MEHGAIVLGAGGGVGSAALFHLARRGVRPLGLDRFPPGHDRGSSHGASRIIRLAYYEHPDYVPLLRRAYELWAELAARSGRRLYHETGLLQVGPREGTVVRGVLASARRHGLAVEELGAREVEARFPGFRVPPAAAAVFERQAGWLAVEECVRAHAGEAAQLGAEVRAGESVIDWRPEGSGVAVRTDRATYRAARLVIAAGAWAAGAGSILGEPGSRLRVKRKPVFWYRPGDACYREGNGCPAYLYETPAGLFYGIPAGPAGEFKVAQHTGGDLVEDPLAVDRSLRAADRERVEDFLRGHLPRALGELAGYSVCLYTMSPDEHFVLGVHPACPAVAFAAGLSGHGFKFTAVLGEALAELALDGRSRLPIEFLAPGRL